MGSRDKMVNDRNGNGNGHERELELGLGWNTAKRWRERWCIDEERPRRRRCYVGDDGNRRKSSGDEDEGCWSWD